MRSLAATVLAAFFSVIVSGCAATPGGGPATIDVLIRGGLVYDGTGDAPFTADIGVTGGAIAFIGDAAEAGLAASEVIEAAGHWVAPGFIDAHSHAALSADYGRDAVPFLHQGITTVVLGVDGAGVSEVDALFSQWEADGVGVNAIHYVGHGYVREKAMGRANRAPTADELEHMSALVRQAMEEGAFGLSTGLFYVPGTYADTEEVIALARVAGEYEGAIYDTHDRDLGAVYQGVGYEASVEEGIRITEEAGVRGVFSHYNLQGAHNYGRAEVGAALINDARARGVDIWAAHHPYTATQSNLRSYTIPNWAAAGGHAAMVERFDHPALGARITQATNAMLAIRGGADKLLFADPRPDLNGKTLADVAEERELSVAETVKWILREGNAWVMNLELYDHANTRRLAQEDWMMTCTDGATPRPDQPIAHPRTFGAFPKKIREFGFEEELLA
ncbi:MAG: amidohydrolase family protein, partial [Caulobacterales bacterium]|nr:amidohydrolase family protein [Caulobacterales bacterium]